MINPNEVPLLNIAISDILVESRTRKEYGDIPDLAKSIRDHGLICPIAVMATPLAEKPFKLLAGERRVKAMIRNRETTIPCRIYDHELTEFEIRSIELQENLARLNLTWAEELEIKGQIHNLHVLEKGEKTPISPEGHGIRDTAKLLHESKSNIARDLNLLKMMEKIPELRSAKTKKEALQVLGKSKKTFNTAEASQRVRRSNTDAKKKGLVSSFHVHKLPPSPTFDQSLEALLSWMGSFECGTFDLCESDPPYSIDLDKIKKSSGSSKQGMENYDEIPRDRYIEFLEKTIETLYSVMADNSWVIWWAGHEWVDTVYRLMWHSGFKGAFRPLVWIKDRGQTNQPTFYLASTYEHAVVARKGGPSIYRQGRSDSFIFPTIGNPDDKIHPTERPIELIQEIIATFIGTEGEKQIICPFLGSGNTILAGANLGHTVEGSEISTGLRDAFIVRAMEGAIGSYRSYK